MGFLWDGLSLSCGYPFLYDSFSSRERVVHYGYMMQSIQGMVMHEVGLMVWHGGIGMMVELDCNHMLGFIGWRAPVPLRGLGV